MLGRVRAVPRPRPIVHPAVRGDRPLVYAHRGGRALRPENTRLAFEHGIACGADGLEMDVHLAGDGEVVVCHDPTLERTTNLAGPVAGRTAAQLAEVDAGYRFEQGGAFPYRGRCGGVPRLRDVLVRHAGTRFIVEMKRDDARLAVAAVQVVRELGLERQVCLSGFGRTVVRTVRRIAPEMATGAALDEVRMALYRSWVRWPARHVPYVALQVPESKGVHRIVTPRFVQAAHHAGAVVQVWTVNEEVDIRRLLDWGVDALITDVPDFAVRVRDAWWEERQSAVLCPPRELS